MGKKALKRALDADRQLMKLDSTREEPERELQLSAETDTGVELHKAIDIYCKYMSKYCEELSLPIAEDLYVQDVLDLAKSLIDQTESSNTGGLIRK